MSNTNKGNKEEGGLMEKLEKVITPVEATIKGIIIPKDTADVLIGLFNKNGSFAIPKIIFDELLGFTPAEDKNRATTYTRKLNKQHSFDTGQKWRIGNNGKHHYTVTII